MKAPRRIHVHKIQSLEDYIRSQNYFSNDLNIMYLANCNKGIYFSSIYTASDFFNLSSDRASLQFNMGNIE